LKPIEPTAQLGKGYGGGHTTKTEQKKRKCPTCKMTKIISRRRLRQKLVGARGEGHFKWRPGGEEHNKKKKSGKCNRGLRERARRSERRGTVGHREKHREKVSEGKDGVPSYSQQRGGRKGRRK